jgi:hypothetical protein
MTLTLTYTETDQIIIGRANNNDAYGHLAYEGDSLQQAACKSPSYSSFVYSLYNIQ